jgi:hypothetical protein
MGIEKEVEELKHRVEALEQLVRSILSKVPEVKIECSVQRIVCERKYEYVKICEDELYGRIIRLALDGFFDEWRSASDVAKGLLRRGWAPKDFKYVRPALDHLVALEVLERERKLGRRAKWLYRKAGKLGEKVTIIEGELRSIQPIRPRPPCKSCFKVVNIYDTVNHERLHKMLY